MPKFFKIMLSILILLALDLLTKYFFYTKKLLPELFTPAFNTWVSRSLPVPHWIIYIIAGGAIIALTWLVIRKQIPRYIYVFFVAWTLGNLIDRIVLGGVRDFIATFDRFPIFNIADVLLNIAIILWISQEFFFTKKMHSVYSK